MRILGVDNRYLLKINNETEEQQFTMDLMFPWYEPGKNAINLIQSDLSG